MDENLIYEKRLATPYDENQDVTYDEDEKIPPERSRQVTERYTNNFGVFLRRERKRRNLTMKDLARLLGVTEGYAGLLERGGRHPSFEIIVSIMEIFNLKADDIFRYDDVHTDMAAESKETGYEVHSAYENHIDSALSILRAFSGEQLTEVCKVLKSLHRMYNAGDTV